jgi:hypothetical protein
MSYGREGFAIPVFNLSERASLPITAKGKEAFPLPKLRQAVANWIARTCRFNTIPFSSLGSSRIKLCAGFWLA